MRPVRRQADGGKGAPKAPETNVQLQPSFAVALCEVKLPGSAAFGRAGPRLHGRRCRWLYHGTEEQMPDLHRSG
jgi:hypothetical protein